MVRSTLTYLTLLRSVLRSISINLTLLHSVYNQFANIHIYKHTVHVVISASYCNDRPHSLVPTNGFRGVSAPIEMSLLNSNSPSYHNRQSVKLPQVGVGAAKLSARSQSQSQRPCQLSRTVLSTNRRACTAPNTGKIYCSRTVRSVYTVV